MVRFFQLACLFFLVGGVLPFQVLASPGVLFVVQTLGGPWPPASLEKLGADWSIELGGAPPRELPASAWVALRQQGISLPPFPSGNSALLTSGDRLVLEPGAPFRLEENRLFLRLDKGPEISFPLAFLSFLCLRVPDGVDDPASFLACLDKSKRSRAVLHLRSGDHIEGTLASPARGPVYTMNLGDRRVDAALDQIAILAGNTLQQARPSTKKAFAHMVTTRGARLQFSNLRLVPQRGVLQGKTLFGANLDIPLGQVAALTMRQGAATYLSDLQPKAYTCTPFLGVTWPLVLDATVTGRQLSLGHDFYDKGLGMHTQSQVTYSLGGNFRWFEASVGLEAGPGTSARARASVLLDGRAAMSRKELSAASPVQPVRLDVRGAKQITLAVDFDDFGDVQGRVNWAEARLLREGK